MTRFYLRTLGNPQLESASVPGSVRLRPGKPLALLTYLSIEGEAVTRDDLADLLWPGADRRHSRASVRQALWYIRRELVDDLFESEDPVALTPGALETDLERFRAALKRGDLSAAVTLWRGEPLEGLRFPGARKWERWADALRTQEEERFGGALAQAAEDSARNGDYASAKEAWRRATEVEPGRLSHHISFIRCLLESHDLQVADEAILSARRLLDDPESQRILEDFSSRLLALRRSVVRDREPRAIRTEFVGRSPEFAILSNLWKEAKTGDRRCGLIQGPPGIGKTRLAEEVALLVDAEGGRLVRVKGTEVGRFLEWGTLGEVARELYGLPGAAGISRRSSAVLTQLLPSLDQGRRRGDRQPSFLPSEQTALADAFRDLVAAVAEEDPLMVVVDDLQWVDRKSQAALFQALRSLPRSPAFFLLTSRTMGDESPIASTVEGLRQTEWARETSLGPLEEPEVAELLALMAEPAEPQHLAAFAERVHGITRGNPLFIVELLNLLQAEGFLKAMDGGRWTIDPQSVTAPLPVPESIEAAIERRLTDVSPEARTVAAYLASAARPQHPERLGQRAGLSERDLIQAAEELMGKDLLRRDSQGRWDFVHDTVREVAGRVFPHADPNGAVSGLARRRGWRAGLLGFGLGGLATALVAWVAFVFVHEQADMLSLAPTRVLAVQAGEGSEERPVEIYLRGRRATIRPPRVDPFPGLTSPDGRRTVEHASTPTGAHLLARDLEAGETYLIMEDRGDQTAEAFSPDGRRLLYSEGEVFDEGRSYRRFLGIFDFDSGEGRRLPIREAVAPLTASWSPDGTRVAFLTGSEAQPRVCVSDLEGAAPWCFSDAAGRRPSRPAWSPDGEQLAVTFRRVSESEILVFPARGGAPTTIGAGLRPLGQPLWLSRFVIACVAGAPAAGDLWVVDIEGVIPRMRRVTHIGDLRGLDRINPGGPSWPWIRSVLLKPAVSAVSPSQLIRLSAQVEWTDGKLTDPEALPLRWDVSDLRVASVTDSGLVRILGEGTVTITATLGGWRSGSVTLSSAPLEEEEPALLFEEDWTEGFRTEEWRPYGTPHPYVDDRGGPEGGGYFVNNGDEHYESGTVSVRPFAFTGGLTVEVWADLAFDGGLYQDFSLGFDRDARLDPDGERHIRDGDVRLIIDGNPPITQVTLGHPVAERLPLPGGDGWRRYALQISSDGTLSIAIDGALFWRSQAHAVSIRENEELFVDLGSRSLGTEVKHGILRVYSGEKYLLRDGLP